MVSPERARSPPFGTNVNLSALLSDVKRLASLNNLETKHKLITGVSH